MTLPSPPLSTRTASPWLRSASQFPQGTGAPGGDYTWAPAEPCVPSSPARLAPNQLRSARLHSVCQFRLVLTDLLTPHSARAQGFREAEGVRRNLPQPVRGPPAVLQWLLLQGCAFHPAPALASARLHQAPLLLPLHPPPRTTGAAQPVLLPLPSRARVGRLGSHCGCVATGKSLGLWASGSLPMRRSLAWM